MTRQRRILLLLINAAVVSVSCYAARANPPDTCDPVPVFELMYEISGISASGYDEQVSRFVAIEGKTAVVAAPIEGRGVTRVFRLSADGWSQVQTLMHDADPFGWKVGLAVSINSDRIAVRGEQDNWSPNVYAALVYRYDGQEWVEEARIHLPPAYADDWVGRMSIALGDGFLAINAQLWGWGPFETLVYRLVDGRWEFCKAFPSIDSDRNSSYYDEVLAWMQNRLFMGGPECVDSSTCNLGAVDMYRYTGTAWEKGPVFVPDTRQQYDRYGYSIAGNDNVVVMGAPEQDHLDSRSVGATYVYRRTDDAWIEEATLKLLESDVPDMWYGQAVAVAENTVAVSARYDDVRGIAEGTVYLYRRIDVEWTRIGVIHAPAGTEGKQFGHSLDMDGQLLIVGALGKGWRVDDLGSAYIYRIASLCDQNGIPEECRLDSDSDTVFDECDNCAFTFNVGQNDTDGDGFGDACDPCPQDFDVEYVDADGDQVGDICDNCPEVSNANQADCDADGVGDACVISVCSGLPSCGDCNENAIPDECDLLNFANSGAMIPEDGATDNGFGAAVDVSGTTAIIGAKLDAENGAFSGVAYIMEFDAAAGQWIQKTKLKANQAAGDDQFGASVAISYSTAAVGAPFNTDNGLRSGSVFVFQNSIGWSQQVELTASDAEASDEFGGAVSMTHNLIVVGAVRDDDGGIDSGAAYVFRYNRDDTTWTQEAKLTASDADDFDSFGQSVAISENVILVGAGGDDDSGQDSGAAYVFRFDGVVWNQETKLTATDGASWDHFGSAVAIYGNVAVVGAPDDDGSESNSGSAYAFVFDGATWQAQTKLLADVMLEGDSFGASVAIGENTIIVGASRARRPGINMGSSYVFEYHDGDWSLRSELAASRPSEFDFFGTSVAVSSDLIIIGAEGRDQLGSTNGAAYTYAIPRDCNQDGVPDECQTGDARVRAGTDRADAIALQQCMSDPCPPSACEEVLIHGQCCRLSDFDGDGDVDIKDYAELQRSFSRP